MYTAAGVVTNLKQLTYRVPGTFKFNKSNFICNGNGLGTRGGRGAPAKWTVRFIFLSLSTIAERFMSAPVRRTTIPTVAVCFFFIFFYFAFYFIPFGSRPIPNIWAGPPGTTTPRARKQYPKITLGFVLFGSFFFWPDRLLNNSACTLEVGSRCETVTALWVHSILVCARKKNPVKWPLFEI